MKKSVFVFWLAVFGFSANIGFAQSFPENFQGTWKRAQYASTLTFTGNTVKTSNRDVFWTLRSVSANKYTIVSSGTGATLALTVRLVDGKLEITGDSGSGEGNWNGSYTNILFAAITFNSQGGSAVASQTVTKGGTVPYPEEPVKAGVYFDGWYKEARCTNPCDYGAPVSGPLTLYAKWLTEKEMIAGEFGESVPEIFEVNNASANAEGQPGWNGSWAKARLAINSGGTSKNYVIKVTGNFQLEGYSSNTFAPGNIKVLVYAPTNKTISSSGSGSLLRASADQTLILRNITLQGSASNNDSLVYSNGTNALMVMRPGTVVSGGVSVDGGTFTMNGGTISGNSRGGVHVDKGGTFTMNGGTISGNSDHGVYVKEGTFTMGGGTIVGNTASGGGGVYVASGTFTMSGGAISGNTAHSSSYYSTLHGYGGGVCVDGGTFTMNGGTINGNMATEVGGGVYVASGTFTMGGGTISGNKATNGGGGVYVKSGTFTMGSGAISGNTASGDGGGVYVKGAFTMDGGTISGNKAIGDRNISGNGGGVNVEGGTFTMSDGAISGNTANGGGGVSIGGGTFTMSSGAISGNTASDFGGGVHVESGTFWLGAEPSTTGEREQGWQIQPNPARLCQ